MMYKSRLVAPERSNRNYYEENIFYKSGYGMPNCTCYGYGRWQELLGYDPKLCINQAELWYGFNDGYERGQEPKLGAIACYKKGSTETYQDGSGHVAIVEEIKPSGDIVLSNSAYKGSNFYLTEHKHASEYGNGNIFQGFIYLPIEFENPMIPVPTPEPTPTPQPEPTPEPVKKTMELVGTIELYDINGNKYPVPSTITKTVEVMGEKIINGEEYIEVYYNGFNPNTVYIKKNNKYYKELIGTVELYNGNGIKYKIPSTISKTVEVLGQVQINGEDYLKIFYTGFNPDIVYIKA